MIIGELSRRKKIATVTFFNRFIYIGHISGKIAYYTISSFKHKNKTRRCYNYFMILNSFMNSNDKVGNLEGHKSQIISMDSNHKYLYSASIDGLICIWDKSNNLIKQMHVHSWLYRIPMIIFGYPLMVILNRKPHYFIELPYILENKTQDKFFDKVTKHIYDLPYLGIMLYKEINLLMINKLIQNLKKIKTNQGHLILLLHGIIVTYDITKILVYDDHHKLIHDRVMNNCRVKKIKVHNRQIYLIITKSKEYRPSECIYILNRTYQIIHKYECDTWTIGDLCFLGGDLIVSILDEQLILIKIPQFGQKSVFFVDISARSLKAMVIFRHNLWFNISRRVLCIDPMGKLLYKYEFNNVIIDLMTYKDNLYIIFDNRIVCLEIDISYFLLDETNEKYHCFITKEMEKEFESFLALPPEMKALIRRYF